MLERTFVFIVAMALLTACSQQNESNNRVIATIGDEKIYVQDVDRYVQQDIYSYMCAIYDIRKIALEQVIKSRLEITDDSIDIESLYNTYNVEIKMQEPISPRTNIDSLQCMTRGNQNSKVCLTIFADYECNLCRSLYKEYEKLFQSYNNDVKFEQVYYAGDVSMAVRGAVAASKQDRFWQMHEKLMETPLPIDSDKVVNIALSLQLDMDSFMYDYIHADVNKIMSHSAYLNKKGIYQTPTVMINHRIFRHPNDIKQLENEIIRAINETR